LALEKYCSEARKKSIPTEKISEDFSYMYKKKFWVLRNLKGLIVAIVGFYSDVTFID
tara:strand:+ start:2262 stop:2432 length:171 start_codon:yes stop_codon:yes gene_type:complete